MVAVNYSTKYGGPNAFPRSSKLSPGGSLEGRLPQQIEQQDTLLMGIIPVIDAI